MGTNLRYSNLTKKCPLLIKFIQENRKVEAFSPDETQRGQQIHQLLSEAIDSKDFSLANAELKCDIGKVFDPLLKQYKKIECEQYGTFVVNGETIEYHIDWAGYNENNILIIDYKSGYWTNILPEYEHQFVYYANALLELFPSAIIKTANYFSASNELTYSKTYMIDDKSLLEMIIKNDLKRWHKIEKTPIEELQPVVNKMCHYCNFPRSCPSYSDDLLDNPEKIILELGKAEERVIQLRRLGRETVKRVGHEILIENYKASYKKQSKRIIDDPIGLFSYLKEHKQDIHTIFKPSMTPYKKYLETNQELGQFSNVKVSKDKFILEDLSKPKQTKEEDEDDE